MLLYRAARTIHDLTDDYLKEMQADDWVRVFHGTGIHSGGVRVKPQDMVFGIDAVGEEATSKYHPSTPGFHRYSGLYIAPNLREANRWGQLIFEFTTKARNLHPTNWSAQIYKDWDPADKEMFDRHCSEEYPNSFNPVLSGSISPNNKSCGKGFRGLEPQALFKGIAKARDILAVHYFDKTYTPQEFIEEYRKDLSYYLESYKSKGPDPKSTTLTLEEYLNIVGERIDKDPRDFFTIVAMHWALDGKEDALRLIKQLAPFSLASAERFLQLLSQEYCDILITEWNRVREKRPDLDLEDPPYCRKRAAMVHQGSVFRFVHR